MAARGQSPQPPASTNVPLCPQWGQERLCKEDRDDPSLWVLAGTRKKKKKGLLGDGFNLGQPCWGQAVPPARVLGSGSSCPGRDAPRSPGWLRLEETRRASEFPLLGSHN